MKKISNKKRRVVFVSFFFCSTFYLLSSTFLYGVDMESNEYRIQYGNIGIGAGDGSSQNYQLSTSLGQTAAGQFASNGYIVKAGFQYVHSIIPFSFKLSNTQIDFGALSPNTPKKAYTALTVSFGSAGQYQVTAQAEGPLKTFDKKHIIPHTNCDGGRERCTKGRAARWNSNTVYGFGYNMKGDDIPVDFTNDSYFRPFADVTRGEEPAIIMHSTNVGRNRLATVTFKANVGPKQTTGSYDTIINFVALPSF